MLWRLKIIIKVLIAHLPIPYTLWQKIGLFRHGKMDRATYVQKIFNIHTQRAFPNGIPTGMTFLELGPGDSVASCFMAYANKATHIHHVDVGCFATQDMTIYRAIADQLKSVGILTPNIDNCTNLSNLLDLCQATYHTHGLDDLEKIPDHSIDFSWSHSVLEHVRRHDFLPLLIALKRITKPGGFSSHIIDLQDHLDHSLNNLRIPTSIWESSWFSRAGFYTNRLQARDIIAIAEKSGFKVIFTEMGKWPSLPIAQDKMVQPFCEMSDTVLNIRTLSLVLQNPL